MYEHVKTGCKHIPPSEQPLQFQSGYFEQTTYILIQLTLNKFHTVRRFLAKQWIRTTWAVRPVLCWEPAKLLWKHKTSRRWWWWWWWWWWCWWHKHSGVVCVFKQVFFNALTSLVCLVLIIFEVSGLHSDTPLLIGHLCMSDRPVAETSTWQHTTITRDRQPCPQSHSDPQSGKWEAANPHLRTGGYWDRLSSLFVCFWRDSPQWDRASSFMRFLDHTQRRITVGRIPLDEWSDRCRDLYLTTHNTHNW